ncbi:MAG: DUF420 domain-containing protein [Cytophagales bacterium]|nr:DUF420 domain-containing protein [Cytophagales bacterium]
MIVSWSEKKQTALIVVLSVVVPLLVAFLLFNPAKLSVSGSWVYFLPRLHAAVNGLTVFVLIYAVWSVKKGRLTRHKSAMTVALILGCLFLVSYVVYHASVPSAKFGGVGNERILYFALLLSHILLAAAALPLVLFAYYFAWTGRNAKHRKIVRYAFPVWLYVSVTGVAVYYMIRPYYLY